jgi:catechol 2,3-dioxygenase-like lactoylglutathione lyase family enzyme
MLSELPVHVTIPASDFERGKRFYAEVVGLKKVLEEEGGAMFSCGEGTRLLVYPSSSGGTASHTLCGFTAQDLEAEMAELRSRGVTFEEYDTPAFKTENGIFDAGPTRAAWFKDSEGNIVGIVQFK